ncbi:DUF819 family protein [Pseudoalteromonas shioyasakiensis]|uniref:DUF819 family protein n=1 Tax=Pseudoalteromonas shioyasakiensis TaxID=1190813 RepID=UPI0021180E90|nr:DUF819 family protein [Pseudoalteromonas shioyasakiensis]
MSIISADNTIQILTVIFLVVIFGVYAEKTSIGKKISAPLIILLMSLIVGNIGILPMKSDIYDGIQSLLVPIAIPLLLFRVDLKKVVQQSGSLLFVFLLAALITVIGALLASSLLDLGEMEAQIVSVLTASNIGGSANFVATSQAVGFTDSSIYLSTLTADAIGAVIFLILLMALPVMSLVTRFVPSKYIVSKEQRKTLDTEIKDAVSSVTLPSVILPIASSLVICTLAGIVAEIIPISGMFIIAVTLLSLVVANFAKKLVARMSFEFELGTLFMYIFFATIGVSADLNEMFGPALFIVGFLLILMVFHLAVLLVIGHWLKIDLAELMIASCACILGPTAAAAIAAGQGWKDLISPGMLVGVLGYAIATFIGVGINYLLT